MTPRSGSSNGPARNVSSAPNLKLVFQRWGGWIASTYAQIFRELNLGREPVVVCPDEPAVEQLVAQIRERFENRLTHIPIPRRPFLKDDLGRRRARETNQVWADQLRRLAESYKPVVIVDEFNGSGGTARRMGLILEDFEVTVSAYAPFLDRAPGVNVGDFPTRALYTIDSPRSG